PHLIDGAAGGANRFAGWWVCADAQQNIQNKPPSSIARTLLCGDCILRCFCLVCEVRRDFNKRGDQTGIRHLRWSTAQNLRWSSIEVGELLAHEITAIRSE